MGKITSQDIKIDVNSGGYVYGTLTSPANASKNVPGSRLILIAHGFGGHKDYCYQKMLAEELSSEGLHTFRFDFRNCGWSSKVPYKHGGRLVTESDFEDFNAIVEEFVLKQNFVLAGVVAHSRGSVAMFYWALHQKLIKRLPTLVNVSGRYDSKGFLDRVESIEPKAREQGWTASINIEGKYQTTTIPYNELVDVGTVDLTSINTLPKHVYVLSIYGLKDHIVPLIDADYFAEKLKPRHTLRLIADADHNFYQTFKIEGKKRINHNGKVVDIVSEWFSPNSERDRFMQDHQYAGIVNRWKDIEGISNFRDFGAFKTEDGKTTVRPDLLFRCANPAKVTNKGAEVMKRLGIKTIFDLRSEQELERAGVANIEGIENKWIPIFKNRDLSPAALAERARNFADPLEGFQRAYCELLDKAPQSYKQIMEHIRDRPNDGFVVHCTAGKDRTGVICALILLLMKVDPDIVAREYELTTFGLVNEFEVVIKTVEKEHPEMSREAKLALLGSRYESMRGTIDIINQQYGGAYNYFKNYCGLTDEDLKIIISNLTAEGHVGWRWVL